MEVIPQYDHSLSQSWTRQVLSVFFYDRCLIVYVQTKLIISEQCMNLGMLHECNAISGHCIIMYLSNVKPERTDDWHIKLGHFYHPHYLAFDY